MDVSVKGSEKSDHFLVNILEELIKSKVKEMMDNYDMCHCEKCYLDACAIALNSVKPRYVTTETGSLLSKITTVKTEYQTDLTVNVLNALQIVKNAPKH